MADEQVQAEATATEAQAQEQTEPRAEQPLAAETPSAQEEPRQEHDQGDLRIPLQEERRKRQEYERELAKLNDPAFIYEQAKKLGLAEADSSYQVPEENGRQQDVASQVTFQLEVERAKEKYPEVTGDPVLAEAAWALVQKGHSPTQAADIVQKAIDKRMAKAVDAEAGERVAREAAAESAKRSAELSDPGTASDTSETDRLTAQSKNWKDPRAQESALLELMKIRMRG